MVIPCLPSITEPSEVSKSSTNKIIKEIQDEVNSRVGVYTRGSVIFNDKIGILLHRMFVFSR